MSRTRIELSLPTAEYEKLKRVAEGLRTLPATLAARVVVEWLARQPDDREVQASAHAMLTLTDWLAPRLDEIRDGNDWPENVTVSVFQMIEEQALELYRSAEAEVGSIPLNQAIGRMVRTRLGTEAVPRPSGPATARVQAGTTSLIKTVTRLKSPRKKYA